MSAVLERLAVLWTDNPLLANAPRTHRTGIDTSVAAGRPSRRRRPADVDAPQVHLGADHRRAA